MRGRKKESKHERKGAKENEGKKGRKTKTVKIINNFKNKVIVFLSI